MVERKFCELSEGIERKALQIIHEVKEPLKNTVTSFWNATWLKALSRHGNLPIRWTSFNPKARKNSEKVFKWVKRKVFSKFKTLFEIDIIQDLYSKKILFDSVNNGFDNRVITVFDIIFTFFTQYFNKFRFLPRIFWMFFKFFLEIMNSLLKIFLTLLRVP